VKPFRALLTLRSILLILWLDSRLVLHGLLVRTVVGLSQRCDRAIDGGRRAGEPMEHHREVAARAEADGARDGVDGEMASHQQRAGAVNPSLHHEPVRRHPHALLEEPRKVVRAHVRLRAQLGQRQRAGKVVVDEFRHVA
jgi:hypothetical protein